MNQNKPISLSSIISSFKAAIGLNVFLTLIETSLMAMIPLFIGFAIDGLLSGDNEDLFNLMAVLIVLVIFSVLRRIYDTRVYGHIRVKVADTLVQRAKDMVVSKLNARLQMGKELVNFLEKDVPELLNAATQLIISLVVVILFK